MKNKIKKGFISFISLSVIGLLTSCKYEAFNEKGSTAWVFVNQSEVDKLLKSQEEIELDEKNYTLNIKYIRQTYRGRGPIGSELTSPSSIRFTLLLPTEQNLKTENKYIKVNNLWIINLNKKFYFETNKLDLESTNIIPVYNIKAPIDYDSLKDNIAIVSFELNNKTYYLKSQINKGYWN